MSQFQMIKTIQKKKMLQTKKGKQELGWNERFYLEKIPNYSKSIEPSNNTIPNHNLFYYTLDPCIQYYKNQINANKKQIISNYKGGCNNPYEEPEPCIDLDPEMVKLWNILCVTDDYRRKFIQKLNNFKEEVHSSLLECEKNSLKKVYEYIMIIKSELNLRDKSIEQLLKLNEVIKEEKIISNTDNDNNEDSLIQNIKDCLQLINQNTINIAFATNELRKIYYYDFIKGKFNKAKVNTNELFDPYFLSKLNQTVQFVFNNEPLRTYLQIKGQYYPMIMDLFSNDTNEEDKAVLKDNCYFLLNEMVYSNYIPHKERDNTIILCFDQAKRSNKSQGKTNKVYLDNKNRGIINTKKYINNPYINNNHNAKGEKGTVLNSENQKSSSQSHKNQEKYPHRNEKEALDCNRPDLKSTSKCGNSVMNDKRSEKNESEKGFDLLQVNDDYINDGDSKNLPKIKKKASQSVIKKKEEEVVELEPIHFEFHTESLLSIQKEYKQYYSLIPSSQRNTFELSNDSILFNEGVSPMLIVGYKKKAFYSLCLLSLDPEDHQIILIKQISTIDNNINEAFLKIIMFIQDNISFKELLINLHFETQGDKYTLNKDLTDVFKRLNFKWSKLENLNSGNRIQTMKFKNQTTTLKDSNDTQNYLCHIKTGIIAWENKEDEENNLSFKGNDNSRKLNSLNKTVINHLMQQSAKATELKNSFNNLITFTGSRKETITFLMENDFKQEKLLSQLDSIDKDKQLYYSSYTLYPIFRSLSTRTINQYNYNRLEIKNEILFEKETNQTFYMLQQDDYVILLGEMSPGFKNYLDNSPSFYDAFNSLYSKIEVIQKDITHIWVPSFSLNEVFTSYSNEDNAAINNYTDASLDIIQYQGKSFSQEPQSNDCVISDSFFLAIISVNLLNSFDISAIFCDIIDQSKWKSV